MGMIWNQMIWNHDLKSVAWLCDLDLNHLSGEDLDFDLKSNLKWFWSWNHLFVSWNHFEMSFEKWLREKRIVV